jgi:hypothetical protein
MTTISYGESLFLLISPEDIEATSIPSAVRVSTSFENPCGPALKVVSAGAIAGSKNSAFSPLAKAGWQNSSAKHMAAANPVLFKMLFLPRRAAASLPRRIEDYF